LPKNSLRAVPHELAQESKTAPGHRRRLATK
jgi:hypothetical protein